MPSFQVLLFVFIFPSFLFCYEYSLTVLAIFQNEAPYLEEWIGYHHMVGVEHFILYNHFSTDDFMDILEPYVASGLVELRDCMCREYPKALLVTYQEGISKEKERSKWLALIDIDEFIVPKEHPTIDKFLLEYEEAAGIVINWQIFGTSGIKSLNGASLLENLIRKFPEDFDSAWNSNHFVKSIIRPDRVDESTKDPNCGNHVFMPLDGYFIVNSDHIAQPLLCKNPSIIIDKMQINHYWFRDEEWFYKNKIKRREEVGESYSQGFIDWLFENGNIEKDLWIQPFVQPEPYSLCLKPLKP